MRRFPGRRRFHSGSEFARSFFSLPTHRSTKGLRSKSLSPVPSEITLGESMRVRCRGHILRVVKPVASMQDSSGPVRAETKIGVAVRLEGYEYLSDASRVHRRFRGFRCFTSTSTTPLGPPFSLGGRPASGPRLRPPRSELNRSSASFIFLSQPRLRPFQAEGSGWLTMGVHSEANASHRFLHCDFPQPSMTLRMTFRAHREAALFAACYLGHLAESAFSF